MHELRFRSIPWLLCAGLALLAALMAGARAQDADKIDPDQVRIITPTGSASTCIGDPRRTGTALKVLDALEQGLVRK